MPTARCHCGNVTIEFPGPPPYCNACQCGVCRRYGVRWGYYAGTAVRIDAAGGPLDSYSYGERNIEFHRCTVCGNVTHWSDPKDPGGRIGVNTNLFEPADLQGVERRASTNPD